MDEQKWLAEQFEANRTHLRAVAYRMLGSLSEADDAVQESWLHLSRSDTSGVENLGGWLTTAVARVCVNMLHAREARREESLEASVPAPIMREPGGLTPRKKRSWPIQWVSRCWWSSTHFLPPSVSRLSCMTSSPCPSTRSREPWSAPRPQQGNSPAAHLAGCAEHRELPTPISPQAEKSWMPSSPPRARVTSTRCWRSSTRTSWSEPTAQPCLEARQGRSVVRWP